MNIKDNNWTIDKYEKTLQEEHNTNLQFLLNFEIVNGIVKTPKSGELILNSMQVVVEFKDYNVALNLVGDYKSS